VSGEFVYDAGEPWLNLLATRARSWTSAPRERLVDEAALGRWLEGGGVRPARMSREDLAAARELREAMRAVACTQLGISSAPDAPRRPAALEVVNNWAVRRHPGRARWAHGSLIRTQVRSVSQILARLADDCLTCLTDHAHPALDACADTECRMLFLDTTGRRRYCGDNCAVRNRVRRHRAKSVSEVLMPARPDGSEQDGPEPGTVTIDRCPGSARSSTGTCWTRRPPP
jgi:predicted RNA-binding Zn ribbon-like protein